MIPNARANRPTVPMSTTERLAGLSSTMSQSVVAGERFSILGHVLGRRSVVGSELLPVSGIGGPSAGDCPSLALQPQSRPVDEGRGRMIIVTRTVSSGSIAAAALAPGSITRSLPGRGTLCSRATMPCVGAKDVMNVSPDSSETELPFSDPVHIWTAVVRTGGPSRSPLPSSTLGTKEKGTVRLTH